MPRQGIEFPPPYGTNLPWPSDRMSRPEYKEACDKWYNFWIEIKGRKLSHEVILEEADKFFEESFNDGIEEYMSGDDPMWKKPRAALIKERALQDWYRVQPNEGKRHNPPSNSFKQS